MLTLLRRRAWAQRRLVAAVVALVAVAATLMGAAALLLGPTDELAFAREVQRSEPQEVAVDAFLVNVDDDAFPDVRAAAVEQQTSILDGLDPAITSVATADVRDLVDTATPGLGYLAAGDGVAPVSELVTGRWPEPAAGVLETTVPEAAARRFGLGVGDRVGLGRASGLGGVEEPVTLEVVGVFRATSPVGWESDLLFGAGFDPSYEEGPRVLPTAGPFVVDDEAFVESGSFVARLRVTARPDLARADRATADGAADALDGATDDLLAQVRDDVQIARVSSALPGTVERIEGQRAAGRSAVLVAVLLGAVLSLAALLLVARLVATVRDDERVLFIALGTSARQQLAVAALEAALLALLAAAIALPAAALLHSWLTRTPGPRAAGLVQDATVTGGLVAAVLGSALVLVPAALLTARDRQTTTAATRGRWALVRSGADLTGVALAAVATLLAWRQLTDQRAAPASGDLALTLAPVVCVVGATVVVVRLVPVLLRGCAWVVLRAPSLVLPLATGQAARRPHSGVAMVLVTAAVAAATFGLGFRATWERSQADQSALRVGTDLALALPGTGAGTTPADAEAVLAAVDDAGAVSAVVDRPLSLGRFSGDADAPPALLAVDSRVAGALLRGRLDGEDGGWAGVGDDLDPGAPVVGPALTDAVTLRGRSSGPLPLTVSATAVVQGAAGLRSALRAAPVPLDGRPHALVWDQPVGAGRQLVALSLGVDGPPPRRPSQADPVDLTAEVTIAGSALPADSGADWQGRLLADDAVTDPVAALERTAAGVRVSTSAALDPTRLAADGGDLLVTAFAPPEAVPVTVSADVAEATGADVGGELAAVVEEVELPLRVVAIVPAVPSAPGRPAVLADADTVSRGLVAAGVLDPVVDAWWVADPGDGDVAALRALELGEVVDRDQDTVALTRAPLQVVVPTAMTGLAVLALGLLLAGVALVTGADQRRRSAELARLRALGLARRRARTLLLVEHGLFLAPLVLLGLAVGAVATAAVGPLMVRSELGTAPVPEALTVGPGWSGLVLLAAVVLGSALVTWVVTARQLRGSDTAGLRMGDP